MVLSLYRVPEETFTQCIYFKKQATKNVQHHKVIKKYGRAHLCHFVLMRQLNVHHLLPFRAFFFSYKAPEEQIIKGSRFIRKLCSKRILYTILLNSCMNAQSLLGLSEEEFHLLKRILDFGISQFVTSPFMC